MPNSKTQKPLESIGGEALEKARAEGWKLHYDTCKHLTTLSTGSILIMVTFIEKLFAKPSWKELIGFAFVSFVLSIITAAMAMIGIGESVRQRGHFSKFDKLWDYATVVVSFLSFFVGIICLVVFALKNLYA